MQPIQRILCPVDFSSVSAKALVYAERLAAGTEAELILLHAFDVPASHTYDDIQNPADAALRQKLEQLPIASSVATVVRILHAGPPGEVICWLAEQKACDLVVMGTHGTTWLKHLLMGSVTEYVVEHARCPVLTVADRPTNEPPLSEPLALPPKAPRFM
jgi:universal stress protein A